MGLIRELLMRGRKPSSSRPAWAMEWTEGWPHALVRSRLRIESIRMAGNRLSIRALPRAKPKFIGAEYGGSRLQSQHVDQAGLKLTDSLTCPSQVLGLKPFHQAWQNPVSKQNKRKKKDRKERKSTKFKSEVTQWEQKHPYTAELQQDNSLHTQNSLVLTRSFFLVGKPKISQGSTWKASFHSCPRKAVSISKEWCGTCQAKLISVLFHIPGKTLQSPFGRECHLPICDKDDSRLGTIPAFTTFQTPLGGS